MQELPFYDISTWELTLLLHDNSHFEDLLFNPISLNKADNNDTFSDFDNELQALINSCKYIFPEDLSKTCMQNDSNNHLSILNLNMRSIPKNFTTLNQLLALNKISFDIIAITETWLHENLEKLYTLNGYEPVFL